MSTITSQVLLGINIDHVATLRQMRNTHYPDPVEAADIAVAAGADSITVHLREDRRHIQDHDVITLKSKLSVPLNLEMAITEEMLAFAEELKPAFCCFVPERRQELTTEGGLDVSANLARVRDACSRMADAGIRTSLFIDPDPEQIHAAADSGAGVIEIHTGRYADAMTTDNRNEDLAEIMAAVSVGMSLGLQINAGHGLNYENVQAIAAINGIYELNIGHSIIARSVFTGLDAAIREMKQLIAMA